MVKVHIFVVPRIITSCRVNGNSNQIEALMLLTLTMSMNAQSSYVRHERPISRVHLTSVVCEMELN